MSEGEVLMQFIDNQHRSKISIAKDLRISKQTLFQYFKSNTLEPETKKKFENYFSAEIFTKVNTNTDKFLKPEVKTEQEVVQAASIKVLFKEVAKIKARVFKMDLNDCIDDLKQNTTIEIKDILKDVEHKPLAFLIFFFFIAREF